MRIVGIVPDRVLPDEVRHDRERWLSAETGLDVAVVNPSVGPAYVESASDQVRAAPHVLDLGLQAEADSADAVVVLCMTDPAIEGLRERLSIPVIGAATASIAFAIATAGSAVVVTITQDAAGAIRDRVRATPGGPEVIRNVVSIDTPIAAMRRNYDDVVEKTVLAAENACRDRAAQAVLLGCTEMGIETSAALSTRLHLPVIDPNLAAFSVASAQVRSRAFRRACRDHI